MAIKQERQVDSLQGRESSTFSTIFFLFLNLEGRERSLKGKNNKLSQANSITSFTVFYSRIHHSIESLMSFPSD